MADALGAKRRGGRSHSRWAIAGRSEDRLDRLRSEIVSAIAAGGGDGDGSQASSSSSDDRASSSPSSSDGGAKTPARILERLFRRLVVCCWFLA